MFGDNVKVLDCTLRDGGYINDWNFSEECYAHVTSELQDAGIDIIELGIIGNHDSDEFKTKFRNLEEIPLPVKKNKNVLFTVMMTGNEYKKIEIPDYREGLVEAIRLAFFKADKNEAMKIAETLKLRGYKVFMQTMATFQYSDMELIKLVNEINDLHPYAFYMVDSFGTFYPEDIRHVYSLINKYLLPDILLGFHAHNNLQMANANVIEFITCSEKRNVIVDGSIYGMGRGAGNACLELIAHYINKVSNKYNEHIIWNLYNNYISEYKTKFAWGYLPEQFMVSKYQTNPAYIWYLSKCGITELNDIEKVLKQIPDDKRYTLDKQEIDKIIMDK